MLEFVRVSIASRVFSLAAVVGLALAAGNQVAVESALLVSIIAAVGVSLSLSSTRPIHWIVALEAGAASLVVAQHLPETFGLLPYLVVLPLVGGLARGVPGALVNAGSQITASALTTMVTHGGSSGLVETSEQLTPWWVTILSAGLVGAWARKVRRLPSASETEENYVAARRLLRQLRSLARQLSSGLDPVGIADELLASVRARLDSEVAAVFARTDGGAFAPLAYLGAGAQEAIDPNDPVIARCWASGKASQRHRSVDTGPAAWAALPLRGGTGGLLGVVISGGPGAGKRVLEVLNRELDDLSLRLDTALAFDEVRSLVTADERQRLAREIHDGVAQEIASLGYVVDEIGAGAEEPHVVEALEGLRRELSRVVSELRLSIFDLRADVGTSAGLGSALSEYARKIGRQSSITVHLTLNEAPTRLTPAVEAELFRIAQEAITNARKHSHAENLWVNCHVDPPMARIEIRDDGRGLQPRGRSSSYGLKIMQERAERIGAGLDVRAGAEQSDGPGTCVTVAVGEHRQHQLKGDPVR